MDRIEIELGDGRKLVAYPYSEKSKFKEVWVDVEGPDGSTTPIAIVGCRAGLPITDFTAKLWTKGGGVGGLRQGDPYRKYGGT